MRKLLLLILISAGNESAAQLPAVRDSLRQWLAAKPSFTMSLDGRNSFIGTAPASVLGGRLGWDYGRVGVYAGLYTLRRSIVSLQYMRSGDTLYRRLGMSYASATIEYLLYKDARWELKIPAQLGLGLASKTNIRNGMREETSRALMFPLEAQATALYRLTRYFGLSAGLGFRMANGAGPSFNGSIYSIGVSVFTGTLYRDMRNHMERKEPFPRFLF
jgi:hypothetical protein